jgi:hypothetical protein
MNRRPVWAVLAGLSERKGTDPDGKLISSNTSAVLLCPFGVRPARDNFFVAYAPILAPSTR